MQKRIFKSLAVVIFTVISIAVFTVSAAAAITVDDGKVVGLDSSVSYQMASVTLENYTAPTYTDVASGSTEISGLTPGIWWIKNTSTSAVTAVWIEGNAEDRDSIGTITEQTYRGVTFDAVDWEKANSGYVAGKWTSPQWSSNSQATLSSWDDYFLTVTGGEHIGSEYTTALANNPTTGKIRQIRSYMQNIVYKYAYASDEIIPVDELYTIGFSAGVRQGSLLYSYTSAASDKEFKSLYKLYTMDSSGNVTTHEAKVTFVHALPNSSVAQILNMSSHFPNASGWVIGIDVHPIGDIPLTGLSLFVDPEQVDSSGNLLNTSYFIQYLPETYSTKNNSTGVNLPIQYNGVNDAYIEGYADGTFKPDSNITKAEIATILARMLSGLDTIPFGYSSDFVDCTANDWYYNAIAYIESVGGFAHVTSQRLEPNAPITRGELAQMLYQLSDAKESLNSSFTDVDASNPYYTAIISLSDKGIIEGYGDGTFRPDSKITRAEAVTLINRIINLVADDTTVSSSSVKKDYSDIDGHWAEYQVLMASNDNVKSIHHTQASSQKLVDLGSAIKIETDQIEIQISKLSGAVTSLINKYDNTDIRVPSASPWFTYLVSDKGINYYPTAVRIVGDRLEVSFTNEIKAYFIVNVQNNYVTFEIDSLLPSSVSKIYFGNLRVNTPFDEEDIDSYRLSGLIMNVNTTTSYFPGGASLCTNAYATRKFGTMGAKMAIVFSKYGGQVDGEHRAILKEVCATIDENGIYSDHGGAFTLDYASSQSDVRGDYVILSSGLSVSNAKKTAETMVKYSIDQLDIHQSNTATFVHGDFNFVCAKEGDETFTTAAHFKERIGDVLHANGVQYSMHTFSSLVSHKAETILSQPKYQQDICYNKDHVLTLKTSITSSDRSITPNESLSFFTLPSQHITYSEVADTRYILIDEEIIRIDVCSDTAFTTVTRGLCGTTKASHSAGAKIRLLQGTYNMFQPIPGSDLFYHIADNTAKAYNEGGFDMIYLDGLESFAKYGLSDTNDSWYYYTTFIQRIIQGCNDDPIIEGSVYPVGFWNARSRAGAWDHPHRAYKTFNSSHIDSNMQYVRAYNNATLGWFHYAPDYTEPYMNTTIKTLFRDDIDMMGSMEIAFDMTTVMQPFSVYNLNTYKTLSNNLMYHTMYAKLRKAGYFSDAVRLELRQGYAEGKEYKLERQDDNSWAFREVKYFKHKVFDAFNNTFTTSQTFTNPYNAQTPYIRIEQRYSTLGANPITVYDFDETAQVTANVYNLQTAVSTTETSSFKINVTGNGSATDALMIVLNNNLNFFVPVNFSGTREIILVDADNADHEGYDFANENVYGRGQHDYNISRIEVKLCGPCNGVMIGDLVACDTVNSPAINPSVTIGSSTITFNTTVRSGEYIEYFPELNKAYLHAYGVGANGTNSNDSTHTATEITFTGSVSVPSGTFTITYNATAADSAPLRAQVVVGLESAELIENEASWTPVSIPTLAADVEWSTLK